MSASENPLPRVSPGLFAWYARKDEERRQRQQNGVESQKIRGMACTMCGVVGHSRDQCDEIRDL